MKKIVLQGVLAAFLWIGAAVVTHAAALDTVVFGDSASESSHSLVENRTQTIAGALGQSARQCLPLNPVDYYGGTMEITMAVDPVRRNYFSLKFWSGDDVNWDIGRIYLYIPDGGTDYQVGFRHEGDYMPLNVANWRQGRPGCFYYSTTLLPLEMTRGKSSLTLKIVSMGRLYPLGSGGEKDGGNYQFLMDLNSRGIYRAYTHVDPYLDVSGETQGSKPATTLPSSAGPEVFNVGGTLENNITYFVNELLGRTANSSYGTWDLAYLAKAYSASRISAGYRNPAVVSKVVDVLDAYATAYYGGTFVPASGWGGNCGGIGLALHHIAGAFTGELDTVANYGSGGSKTRREAWGDMLEASRDYGRFNRRTLSNQNFIGDENVFLANRGLQAIGDARAFSVADGERYAREAGGLEPWLGSDLAGGGHSYLYGTNYYQVTAKGQTREWGYVGGNYGEMMPHVLGFYDVSGNTNFLAQAVKMAKARAPFRRPSVVVDGSNNYDHMEVIGLLAWRGAQESDGNFGDDTAYVDRNVLAALHLAAQSLDPEIVGYLQHRIDDNRFFGAYADWNNRKNMLVLDAFDDYAAFAAAADTGVRLPMKDGQPDFAWADEGNRILALKHGSERLWITPYWQAKYNTGINGVARFQFDAANYTQYGVLETVPQFTFGGSFTRTTYDIDKPEGFQWWPPSPRPLQAYGNETLPLGPTPPEASNSDPFRGKADFYAFRFGKYLMGINASEDKSFELKTPVGFTSATDLVSGSALSGNITVAPVSSVALVLPDTADAAPVPGTPLYIDGVSDGSGVTLSWSAASGAETYTVFRSVVSGGPYTIVGSGVTNLTWSDAGAVAGQTYYYRVAAANVNGQGYPGFEREILATQADGIVSFNLMPSGNTAMTAADQAGAPGVRVANWNMFSGGTLSSGIVDGGGDAVPGMSVSLTWGSTGGLLDRGGSTGNDTAMFSTVLDQYGGTPSTITVSGVPYASYDVYVYMRSEQSTRAGSFAIGSTTLYARGTGWINPASDGSGYIESTDTTYGAGTDIEQGHYVVITNVTGSSFALSLNAVNAGDSVLRNKVAGFQVVENAGIPPVPPTAPLGLSATPAVSGQVDLSWQPSTGATGYSVKRASVSGGPYVVVATDIADTNFNDTGLVDGAICFYVVSARGAGGESADSVEVSVVPSPMLSANEFMIDNHAFSGESNLLLVVSNSVVGHRYQLLASGSLVPTDWQPVEIVDGNASDIQFNVLLASIESNRFFKLDVQRK